MPNYFDWLRYWIANHGGTEQVVYWCIVLYVVLVFTYLFCRKER